METVIPAFEVRWRKGWPDISLYEKDHRTFEGAPVLLELHCHTAEHSACSHVAAVELVKRVYEMNLHGIVITDHHYLWPDEELDALRRSAGLPPSFVVLSGQETTTAEAGDVLVYGAGATVPPRTPLASIRAANPAAALILAHPFRDGKRPSREKLLNPLIDGVEIFNSNHSVSDNVRGLGDWHRYKFIAIAGTDTHGISYAGTYPTHFDHPIETMGELVEALKKGNCQFCRAVSQSVIRPYRHASRHTGRYFS